MTQLLSFFKLIRWVNLLFIALTQCLFYFFIVYPVWFATQSVPPMVDVLFWLLLLSSLLVAAGGYIINDYFDVNIDLVNKPDRMVVDKSISRRWAILWHFIFSCAGVLLGFYIGVKNGNWLIGIANLICVLLLWFYSTSFKKQLLSGNILISLLTAWVVMVVYLYAIMQPTASVSGEMPQGDKLLRLALVYASFAFLISLVREVVKDMEDVEGDRRYGCNTMPIAWGLSFSKVFTGIWLVILLVLLLVSMVYVLYFKMWLPAAYHFVFIIIPTMLCLRKLPKAIESKDFHALSIWIKLIMLTGILSMIYFKFYA